MRSSLPSRLTIWSLYGLLFFLPISKAAIEIFFGLALTGFLLKRWRQRNFSLPRSTPFLFLYLFLIFCAFSLINSGIYFPKSLHALLSKWSKYAVLFLILRESLTTDDKIHKAVTVLLASSALIGVDGLFQYFSGMDFLRHRSLVVIGHISGVPPFHYFPAATASLEHYNSLGTYLMCLLLIATALFLSKETIPKIRFLLAGLMVLLGGIFLLTFSRGAWLGFLAGLVLMLFLSKRTKTVMAVGSFFVATAFLWPVLRERIFYEFHSYYGENERSLVWNLAWRMITENPWLGKGIGTFMDYTSLYSSGIINKYAHNCYLQMWAETGIFALLSFIFLSRVCLRMPSATSRKNPTSWCWDCSVP